MGRYRQEYEAACKTDPKSDRPTTSRRLIECLVKHEKVIMNTPIDSSTLAGKIAVMTAAKEGKKIQSRPGMHGPHVQWFDCEPDWNWIYFDYRVTPVSDPPVYRPWRHEEVPVGKIVKEADPSRLVVRMIDAAEYGDIHLGG